ncbi:hypothetical protein TWF730_007107 [Orbilia blumenaviensis]|uniref:Uncharacterized protein n=1 Tax=Orbilia blumenaviensis TaxID=1796055 RepID=A0AAV9VHQ2_9PEZI
MKFFSSSVIVFGLLGSFFTSAVVIPVEKRELAPIQKRAPDLGTAIGFVKDLFDEVQAVTGKINATTAGLSDPVTVIESTAATLEINALLQQLTAIITGTTTKISTAAPLATRDVIVARQAAPTDLANLVTLLLLEISGTLNAVITALGLKALLAGTLSGLVAALSGLLLALVPVVDNLLELVRRLLDGLLIGLSAALAGLII